MAYIRWKTDPSSPAETARRGRFSNFMDVYYMAREADLLEMEYETSMYDTEVEDWKDRHQGRPLTFHEYLIQSRGIPR